MAIIAFLSRPPFLIAPAQMRRGIAKSSVPVVSEGFSLCPAGTPCLAKAGAFAYHPSIEECDIWNIEATFLDALPDDVMHITADPVEIGVNQLEEARTDGTRTSITIRTERKSRLEPGAVIHLSYQQS